MCDVDARRDSPRRWLATACSIAALALAIGCGDDGEGGAIDAAVEIDTGAGGDGGAITDWQTLIDGTWSLAPGTEDYICVRLTVQEDMYITEFRAKVPLGTHHSVLTVGQPGSPDGISSCTSFTNLTTMIYGAGINTDPIALPEGVAMKVRAGQQLLLNLHLFNASDAPLDGLSGVEFKTIPQSEVVHEAEVLLMGKVLSLNVPQGASTQTGSCQMNGDVTLFMVSPHMHQLGTHMRVVAERSGQPDMVLHDAPYDFEDQQIYPIEPIEMALGDRLRVECSYDNDTGSGVGWGESSDEEMCFATTFRYPAYGGLLGIVCADD